MEQKRLIFALVLSVLVIAVYQRYVYKPASYQPGYESTTGKAPNSVAKNINDIPVQDNNYDDAIQVLTRNEQERIIESSNLIVTCSNITGCIKKIQLKNYLNPDTKQPLILSETNKNWPSFIAIIDFDHPGNFDSKPNIYSCVESNNKLIFSYSFPYANVTKEYSIDTNDPDIIKVSVKLNNISNEVVAYEKLGVIISNRIEQTGVMASRYSHLTIFTNIKKHSRNIISKKIQRISEPTYCVSLTNKYFTFLVKPKEILPGIIINKENDNYPVIIATNYLTPAANNKNYEINFNVYAGPTKPNIIARATGMKEYELSDSGFFAVINKSINAILSTCYQITKNWGIAIILLSMLINILFFPLTKQSLLAMKKIQALQPELELLKERNKNNPQRLNKEMIEFWQKNKVNPFSGCLPMIVQLPIFFALYNVFMKNISLRNASFLWIKDLASPDIVRLPLLPNASIHLLPILMAGVMFIQQKLAQPVASTANSAQANQQKFLSIFFPIFLGFVLYSFPSGLVLYWVTSTVFNLLEHLYITRKIKIS